jgi:hypothetical protein
MYENSVNGAWNTYTSCMQNADDDPWYLRGINMNVCFVEWVGRAEAAWFQFIACFPRIA